MAAKHEPGRDHEDEPDEATRAFEDLRAEVAGMRRAIEKLGPALQALRSTSAPDYSPTLGVLSKDVDAVAVRIDAIEKHTAAKLSPEAYEREMGRTREGVLRPFRDGLESARREVIDAGVLLRNAVGAVRERKEQTQRLLWTAIGGVAAGLVAFPLLVFPIARALPFDSLPDAIATSALGEDRWDAGMGLMMRANPAKWNGLVEGYNIARAGGDELKACQEAAVKAGKSQRCTITMVNSPGSARNP